MQTDARAAVMAETADLPLSATGADQTATASPLSSWSEPWTVELKQLNQRKASFPTLQAFSAGQTSSGEWVLIGGRTNGLHNFTPDGKANFPPSHQNERIWVYDPVRERSWSRPLTKSGLGSGKQLSLSTTNAQQFQRGDVLFRVGGYVYDEASQSFSTRNRLSAIQLDDLAAWAQKKTRRLPKRSVLSVAGEAMQVNGQDTHLFAVTGGEMLKGENENQAQLIFGQDFSGGYTPGSNGLYTAQARNFDIRYKPNQGKLSYRLNSVSRPDDSRYRRRDLNIVNQLKQQADGELSRHGEALGGVFYGGAGVWTVPVQIDLLTGQPTMANADDPATFRQGINQYTAANLGLYSRGDDSQTSLIFGGISAITLDPEGQPYYVNRENNPDLAPSYPFTSQIAAIKRNADNSWTQALAGSFPSLENAAGEPLTYGASSAFIPLAPGQDRRVRYLADGVVDLDRLQRRTRAGEAVLVGYVVGGIESQVANDFNDLTTYGSSNYTVASGEIFKVMITPN